MRVLVTGASGMLGGAVASSLAQRGDDVVLMQRRPSGLDLPERLVDLRDREGVRSAVRGMDGVIHLAAKVNVVGPWAAPARRKPSTVRSRASSQVAGRNGAPVRLSPSRTSGVVSRV